MNEVESQANNLISQAFSIKELPFEKIKSISLHWETVGSEYLPFLEIEFYSTYDVPH